MFFIYVCLLSCDSCLTIREENVVSKMAPKRNAPGPAAPARPKAKAKVEPKAAAAVAPLPGNWTPKIPLAHPTVSQKPKHYGLLQAFESWPTSNDLASKNPSIKSVRSSHHDGERHRASGRLGCQSQCGSPCLHHTDHPDHHKPPQLH